MDNNQQTTPNPAPAPQPAAQAPAPTPQATPTEGGGESKKLVMWLIIGLVVVAVAVGGIYLFLSKQNVAQQAAAPTMTAQQPITPRETLEEDLSTIDVDSSLDSEFAAVDQDLGQL